MDQDLERGTRQVGAEIYSSIKDEAPSFFEMKRWKGKIMRWAMKDEAFKVQLFRFIDLLPSLETDILVTKLIREYFYDQGIAIPKVIDWLIKGLSQGKVLPRIAGKTVKFNVETLARQFIAGNDHKHVLKKLAAFWDEGLAYSVDLLGEVVVSEQEALEYNNRYLEMIDAYNPALMKSPAIPMLTNDDKGAIPRLNCSFKISSFYSQTSPVDWDGSIKAAIKALRPIFRRALELGISLTFDMEHYYFKGLTIDIFKSIMEEEEFETFQFAGIAIQAYLKDSREDLLGLMEWARRHNRVIAIRLVKGAYWDYEIAVNQQKGWPVPVFMDKDETDLNFEALTRILLENTTYVRPAIASHNFRSISRAIAIADALRLPKAALEFQTLYGMAENLRDAVKERGYRVRVYTPVGELIPGMAYFVRRLLENTSNESFLRRSVVEKRPFEELIKAPAPKKKIPADELKQQRFKNEPTIDFSRAANRRDLEEAIVKVRKELDDRYPLYIGRKEVWKETELASINPARPGEVIGRVSQATQANADLAVNEAIKAWEGWKVTSPRERAGYLFKAAERVRALRFEFIALEIFETGKTWLEADGDIAEAIDFLEYYGNEMIRLGHVRRLGDHIGEVNEYSYKPRGVGAVIAPWNFPFAIPAGMVSAGIVTGNCIILKPSGQSPVMAWRLIEIFRSIGLPPGVLQFLPGPGGEVGEHLVTHPKIDFICFTGSKEVGLRIVELAGKTGPSQRNVKKVISEMGGKNTIIVDETADLDEAVKGILESSLGYQGQKCSACSRVVMVGDRLDIFCKRLKEATESIKIGPPEEPGSFMGPVINAGAVKRIKGYIERGSTEDKALLLREAEGEGYFVGPSIFLAAPDSSIAQEEIFGPILVIIPARTIEEAIAIANNTIYGLTGGIFSRSPANIAMVKDQLDVGNIYINRKITGALVGRQPFGGLAMSGVGSKAGGPDYLLQFMSPKTVTENTMRRGFAPLGTEKE